MVGSRVVGVKRVVASWDGGGQGGGGRSRGGGYDVIMASCLN